MLSRVIWPLSTQDNFHNFIFTALESAGCFYSDITTL